MARIYGVIDDVIQLPLPGRAIELLVASGELWGMNWTDNKASVIRHLLATCPSLLQVARTEFGMTPEDVLALFAVKWGVRVDPFETYLIGRSKKDD